jgi:hypothetical protein
MADETTVTPNELREIVWNDWSVADRLAVEVASISRALFDGSFPAAKGAADAAEKLSAMPSSNAAQRWWTINLVRAKKSGHRLGLIECRLAPLDEDDLTIICVAKLSQSSPLGGSLADAQNEALLWMNGQNWPAEFRRDDLGRNELVLRKIRKSEAEGSSVDDRVQSLLELLQQAVDNFLRLFEHWDDVLTAREAPSAPAVEFATGGEGIEL